MITQTAEYALRAVVFLAEQNEPTTTMAIARSTQLPAGYLAKVMQGLSRAKLVHAQRGLHGGFTLSRGAEELTLLEVINAVEPVRRFHDCPLGLHGKDLCPLHQKLDQAACAIQQSFGSTTVADLLGGQGKTAQLALSTCVFPPNIRCQGDSPELAPTDG